MSASAPSSVRRWLALAVAAALAVGLLYAALSATVLHGEVTASSLTRSVEGTIDAGGRIYDDGVYGCAPSGPGSSGVWTCAVPSADSGLVTYRVVVERGGSCWEARAALSDLEAVSGMPKRASGCVRRLQLGF